MRRIDLFVAALLTGMSVLFSCKGGGDGKAVLQPVTGAVNELMVVMPNAFWKGAVGDTIRSFFGQEQVGLPQAEPVFDLINLPPANFVRNARAHRNILLVSITPKADSASLVFFDSPWARTQKIFKLSAPDVASFYKVFDKNKEKMMGVYLKAERDRLIGVYKKRAGDKIFRIFKKKYDMLLYCPEDYVMNKDTNDFVWISKETKADSRGIVFFQRPYESRSQLEYTVILDEVNGELKKYIPGPRDSTWMALDVKTPITAAAYKYDGEYYAMLLKGLWVAENDFMGGPFVLNVVLDEKNNRVIYMMGYVYAPESAKRNMLRQVESILASMKLDYDEKREKD